MHRRAADAGAAIQAEAVVERHRALDGDAVGPLRIITGLGEQAAERIEAQAAPYKSMPDDHSKLVPPLRIPNRTVKQLCADDSAATSVKVGYRQASYIKKPLPVIWLGLFCVCAAPWDTSETRADQAERRNRRFVSRRRLTHWRITLR